jgi:inner membrane protein
MDNLAHTLVGAALAEAGLKRKTALAAPTLMIAANLPDIDVIAGVAGSDAALYFRRGITHGVLAWLVLPAMLAGVMVAWDRFVRRRRRPDAEPVRVGALVALSYLGLLTHPFLDWLNTYGVRLLMPFDGRWFYGDTLFIVDPWLWLLCGSSVVIAHSSSKLSITGWSVLGLATTALILGFAEVSIAVKLVWLVAIAAIVALRLGGWLRARSRRLAVLSLALASVYVAAMISSSVYSAAVAAAEFEARGVAVNDALPDPVPGNPLKREGIVTSDGEYRFFAVRLASRPRFEETRAPLAIEDPGAIVEAALASPEVRGFRNWMRYPSWDVRRLDDGWRVILRDLRYAAPDAEQGFGVVRVDLDDDLRPR